MELILPRREKLKDILEDSAKTFSVPESLLHSLIVEERKRLYKIRRRYISDDIEEIFEKHARAM